MILSRCYYLVSNHWGKNTYCINFYFSEITKADRSTNPATQQAPVTIWQPRYRSRPKTILCHSTWTRRRQKRQLNWMKRTIWTTLRRRSHLRRSRTIWSSIWRRLKSLSTHLWRMEEQFQEITEHFAKKSICRKQNDTLQKSLSVENKMTLLKECVVQKVM